MEVRGQGSSPEMQSVHANISPYVGTSGRKMAETPMAEGENADAYKTYGPFSGVSMKGNVPETEDPVEKAIDSIFFFFDDVREATETQRERCGEMSFADSTAELNGTLERLTDGICKNPCMEDCSRIQPPADLMLSVEHKSMEAVGSTLETVPEDEAREETEEQVARKKPEQDLPVKKEELHSAKKEEQQQPQPKSQPTSRPQPQPRKISDYALSKENSVKDMSMPEETLKDETALSPEQQDTIQLFKDTIISVVPDEYKEQLKEQLDYYLPDERVLGIDSPVDLPDGEYPVDEDPVVEAIDRLILMFDELKEGMEIHKVQLLMRMEEQKADLILKAAEMSEAATRLLAVQPSGKLITNGNEAEAAAVKSDATAVSEDTEKIANIKKKAATKKKFPSSTQMAPEELSDAVVAAANILADTAPEEDREKYSSEELHQRALERIMSERSEYEEELSMSADEYKSEDMILSELLREADQAIMDARSQDDKDKTKYMMAPPKQCPTDELAILETSVTLTPIPEADDEEASPETPSIWEKLEKAMTSGDAPQVPMTKESKKEPEKVWKEESPKDVKEEPAQTNEADEREASEAVVDIQDQTWETRDEKDPIIKMIDNMFLYYDEVSEKDVVKKGCVGCIGGEPTDSDVTELKEMLSEDTIKSLNEPVDIGPRTEDASQEEQQQQPHEQKEQQQKEQQPPSEEKTVSTKQEKKTTDGKDYTSPIDLTVGQSPSDPVVNAIDDLVHAFEEAKEQEEALKSFTEKLNSLKEYILKGSSDKEDQQVAEFVNSAYKKNDEQRLSKPDPRQRSNVEFEFPESLKHDQDPYISWGGDDSELMASINADRKLSELEHANIFRDVSKGLDASAGGIITRADNKEIFFINKAPAFTEGNSGSRSHSNEEDRMEKPSTAEAAGVTVLSGECLATQLSPDKVRAINKNFQGWSLSKKREQMLKNQLEASVSI